MVILLKAGDIVYLWSPKLEDGFLLSLVPGRRLGSHVGVIGHDDILASDYGKAVMTHTGHSFYILKPMLGEYTRKLKRKTQIVFPKETGFILLYLDIFPGATVVECGTGSGSLTATLAHFVGDGGRVISYDRRGEFSKLAEENCKLWKVAHRVTFKVRDIAEGFDEREADAVFLDLPDPWNYLHHAILALAPGRRLGMILPTTNQVQRALAALKEQRFADIQVIEVMHRYWKTDPERLRPEDMMVGHTGYLIFAARVEAQEAQ